MKITNELLGNRILFKVWPTNILREAIVHEVTAKGYVCLSYELQDGGKSWIDLNDLENYNVLEILPLRNKKDH